MFVLRTALLNIRRHKQKSILVAVICAFIVLFVFIYISNISSNQNQLDSLPQSIPVTARIENHVGSQVVGLIIGEYTINNIKDSGYAKDLFYTAQLAANFSSMPNEEDAYKEISIKGVNDINAIPNMQERTLDLMDTVDPYFLHGTDPLCIASESFLEKNSLNVGDNIMINLYNLNYDPSTKSFVYGSLGKCSLLIAGSISSYTISDVAPMDIICPIGWARDKHAEVGADFYSDSVTFTVSDPMNLDAFKAAMKKCYLVPVDPLSEETVVGDALSVSDETFIKTAARLKSSLAVLYAFAPVVFIVIALVGYAVSYLLMQGRLVDIVIMRSLGMSRFACIRTMFLEYAVVGLCGALAGSGCGVIFMGFDGSQPLLITLLFYLSFMFGIIGAAFQLSRRTAMSGFVKAEA